MRKLTFVILLMLSSFAVHPQERNELNDNYKEHSVIDQDIIEALIKSEFQYLTKRPSWDESYYGLTGSLSGAGFMVIMKKVGKKWKVKEKAEMWIA